MGEACRSGVRMLLEQVMMNGLEVTKRYLMASDFDQTLSFNDSGIVLSEVVGVSTFQEKGGRAREGQSGPAGR
jgi:hypothetical protein